MGALFGLVILFVLIGIAYPAVMALLWVVARLTGSNVKFSKFMRGV